MARRALWANVVFAVCTVIGQLGQNVTLPLFADVVAHAGGSPYFIVWFASLSFVLLLGLILLVMWWRNAIGILEFQTINITDQRGPMQIGLADAVNGMMVVFASPSTRTAPYLQAILGNFSIPVTIVVRFWLLKKAPSCAGIYAAALVLAGLFVALIPSICDWDGPDLESAHSVLWPMWFMAGFIPAAVMSVLEERVLQTDQQLVHAVWLVFSLTFWQLTFVSALFWLDMVPGYGMSPDFASWAWHMYYGFLCFIPGDTCGYAGFTWGTVFILCYLLAYVASAFLLRYSEGAVWQVIVSALVSPLGALWWTLFQEKPTFHWQPEWASTTTFSLLGLTLMIPGIIFYKLWGSQEPRRATLVQPLL